MKRYHKIMDKIEVTEEMRERIVRNIHSVDLNTKYMTFKKSVLVIACITVFVIGIIKIPNLYNEITKTPIQVGPKIIECASIKELSDTVQFKVETLTYIPFEASSIKYVAFGQKLAEVTYANDEESIVYRKSIGIEDNSGNFNAYDLTKEIIINTNKIIFKGDSNLYTLALWEDGKYSYSIAISKGKTEVEWQTIISNIQ